MSSSAVGASGKCMRPMVVQEEVRERGAAGWRNEAVRKCGMDGEAYHYTFRTKTLEAENEATTTLLRTLKERGEPLRSAFCTRTLIVQPPTASCGAGLGSNLRKVATFSFVP